MTARLRVLWQHCNPRVDVASVPALRPAVDRNDAGIYGLEWALALAGILLS